MPFFEKSQRTDIGGNPAFNDAGGDIINNFGVPPSTDLYRALDPVAEAAYNRPRPARCYPGTRLAVIATIEEWVKKCDKEQPICWLNGPAGYGKSALAQTIAENYARKHRLVGSFFFLRGAGDRSHINRLIQTLAHQLSNSIPATKSHIMRALRKDPTIFSTSIAHQFQRLIVDPTCSASNFFTSLISKPRILVIDALDECDDKISMAEFIDAMIHTAIEGHLPFGILVTSRVEDHIWQKLGALHTYSQVLLQMELESFDASQDIQAYFKGEFDEIYRAKGQVMRFTPQPWPSQNDLSILLDKAGSSFIFAVMLMKLIGESKLPDNALKQVLCSGPKDLDLLYNQVLDAALQTTNSTVLGGASVKNTGSTVFHRVLGTIMILQNNQSILTLSTLLGLPCQHIVAELLGVQSIIRIPGDDNQPVMPYHTSLRDFLTTESRSLKYYINPPICHILLATDCLQVLEDNSSEDFFEGDTKRYASLQWPHHLLIGFEAHWRNYLDGIVNDTLVTYVNSLIIQIKRWYNTILNSKYEEQRECARRVKALTALSKVSIRSIKLEDLFKEVNHLIETEEKNFWIEKAAARAAEAKAAEAKAAEAAEAAEIEYYRYEEERRLRRREERELRNRKHDKSEILKWREWQKNNATA